MATTLRTAPVEADVLTAQIDDPDQVVLRRPVARDTRRPPARIEDVLTMGRDLPPEDPAYADREAAIRARQAINAEATRRYSAFDQASQVAQGNVQAADQIQQLLGARVSREVDRPFYEATKKYTDTMAGLLPGQVEAQQGIHDARLLQEQQIADVMEDQAARQRDAMIDMRANQHAQAERAQRSMQRMQQANDMVMEAAQQFANAPEIDPGRFWASRTAGQKFAAAISMGLLGASGNVGAALGFINNAIQADIDAQKANLAKRQTSYGMASEQFGREQNMYQQMRALAADEREADLMFTKARLQQAQMEMQAKLQRAGVQTLNAQQQAMMNALQQEIAAKDLQLAKMIEANTPTMVVSRKLVSDPMERKLLYERGKAAIEGAQGLQKEAIGAAFKAEEQEREMATKRMDARTKELRGEGGVLAEARQYAEKAAAAEGVIRLIDQISTQEDIPGVGSYFGAHELSPGARDTDAQVRALVEALGRMQSGAVISAEEEKRFREMIVGGIQLGGETRLRKNLAVVRDMARAKLETYERALSPEARAYIRRNQALPEFRAEFTGSTNAEDVVAEDQ